jgi:hypothetical protein
MITMGCMVDHIHLEEYIQHTLPTKEQYVVLPTKEHPFM